MAHVSNCRNDTPHKLAFRLAVAGVMLLGGSLPLDAQHTQPTPRGLLARPLPGTLAREDDDIARSAENALVGFADIASAHVVISRPDGTTTARRCAAAQIALTPSATTTRVWVETVALFVTQTVPHLDPEQLTIITDAGVLLYAHGRPAITLAEAPPPQALATPSPLTTVPWWAMVAALALGCIVTLALATMRRPPRTTPSAEPVPSGPFAFLHEATDEELAVALGGEREAVVAAVLAQLPGKVAARARKAIGLSGSPPQDMLVPTDALTAMAAAMREKLDQTGPR